MVGYGRENPKDNDLFFTCSLIDYIARKTKNERVEVVNQLGKKRLAKIYELADIYHSDNIDRVSDDFIREAGIQTGTFDNVKTCGYAIPSHWDIGKVYKRLIKGVAQEEQCRFAQPFLKTSQPPAPPPPYSPSHRRLRAAPESSAPGKAPGRCRRCSGSAKASSR